MENTKAFFEVEKAWLRKHKLATTKLKQIRRKVGIWERKAVTATHESHLQQAEQAWEAVGI